MELIYECPSCEANGRVASVESEDVTTCPSCSAVRTLNRGMVDDAGLCSCAWCSTTDLYIQKDFPQGLGLAIVVVGFAISTVFWWLYMPKAAYSILLASAAIDLALFYLVPEVTICYRCLAQHRGPGSNPPERFHPFDLAIGERYRQERIRIEELLSTPPRPL